MPFIDAPPQNESTPKAGTGGFIDASPTQGGFIDDQPSPAPTPVPGVLSTYQPYVDKYSKQYGVDPKSISTLLGIESAGGRDMRDSSAGAKGIAQFMPATAKGLGIDPKNPEQGIMGAAHYYSNLLKEFGGDKTLAAAAYNAGPAVIHGWLKGQNALPTETINYMTRFAKGMAGGSQGIQTKATAEQSDVNRPLDNTAKLSSDKPGGTNPFGTALELDFSKAVQSVNDQLNHVGTAINTAGKVTNKDVYHPANKGWLELKKASEQLASRPLQTFVDWEGVLMRGVEQVHADESNKEVQISDAYKAHKQAYNEDIVRAKAVVATAADYFMHPGNMAKVLHAIKDPAEAQILTDTLERNWAHQMNMPDPTHWPVLTKIAADIATEGSHDPFSYVGLGNAATGIKAGMELLSHANVGMGVGQAVKLSLSAAKNGLVGKAATAATKHVGAILQAIHNVQSVSSKMSDVSQKLGTFVSTIRPDLDKHFADNTGKMAFLGLSDSVDHVVNTISDDVRGIIDKNPGMKTMGPADPLPLDAMQHRLQMAYKYGTKADAKRVFSTDKKGNVSGLAAKYGWRPKPQDQLPGAFGLGYVSYGKNTFLPRLELQAIPKNASPQLKDAFEFFKGAPDIFKEQKGGPKVNDVWADSIADLQVLSGTQTLLDLYKHSATVEQDAIRTGMLSKMAGKLARSVPGMLSAEAMAKIGSNIPPQALTDPIKLKNYLDKATVNYFATQVGLRPPVALGGGKNQALKTVLGGLDNVSKLWKTSLTGTGLIVHAMKNVGTVALMMSGSPMVAAKGLMRGFKGTPTDLMNRMKAGGSWSNYWHETPEILKSLGLRTGLGAAIGGAAGNANAGPGATPVQRIGDIGIGAAAGAGLGAALPAMANMMDKMENGIRSAYLEHLDLLLGKPDIKTPLGAMEEYARNAKVTKDLGGYKHTSMLVQFMQGIGGTFVAYRLGTVPRAFADTIVNRPGIIANSERAVQDISAKAIPANRGQHDPSKSPVEMHALGPIDEGIEEAADVATLGHEGFFSSPATLGPIPGGILRSKESEQYNRTHPTPLSRDIGDTAYSLAGMAPGGASVQSLTPGLSPYKDNTGLPFWAQELLHATNVYGKKTSRYTASEIRHGFAKAENQ